MALQQRQSLSHRASGLAWKTEQTLTLFIAVSFGTAVGLLIGLFRALRSLAPHFQSREGLKRLYYGDPSLAHKFQRGYIQGSYTSATLKPHGASPTLSSTGVGKTAVPSLVNGDVKGHTQATPAGPTTTINAAGTTTSRPTAAINGAGTTTTNGLLRADHPGSGASYEDDITPKSTTTTASTAKHDDTAILAPTPARSPGDVTPEEEDEGDSETETEGETGSEYTATSSTPGTPRSTIVAPPGDASQKKKKRKTGRKIKKAFSKIADVFTPGSSSAKA